MANTINKTSDDNNITYDIELDGTDSMTLNTAGTYNDKNIVFNTTVNGGGSVYKVTLTNTKIDGSVYYSATPNDSEIYDDVSSDINEGRIPYIRAFYNDSDSYGMLFVYGETRELEDASGMYSDFYYFYYKFGSTSYTIVVNPDNGTMWQQGDSSPYWQRIQEKPFSTIGSGLTVSNNELSVDSSGLINTVSPIYKQGNSTTAVSGAFASGLSTTASASNSTALGIASNASGQYSTALGYSSNASGRYSLAIGQQSGAKGECSTAINGATADSRYDFAVGNGASASGSFSTAIGYMSKATGYGSTTIGNQANASENRGIAIGDSTNSIGVNSVSIGMASATSGLNAIALGVQSGNSGENSIVIGTNNSSSADSSIVLGCNAKTITPDSDSVTSSNSIAIGNGSSSSGTNNIVIGTGAQGNGCAVVIGQSAISTAPGSSVAVGNGASAKGIFSTAVGASGATASEAYAIAVGNAASASGNSSSSFGYGSSSSASCATAIGAISKAASPNSVAIGYNSATTENDGNAVSVGKDAVLDSDGVATTEEYTRRIIHVSEPTSDSDAATKGYVDNNSKPFVLTVTYDETDASLYSVDQTYDEVLAAYNNGQQVNVKIVNYPNIVAPVTLPLMLYKNDSFVFSGAGTLDDKTMTMTAIVSGDSFNVTMAELGSGEETVTLDLDNLDYSDVIQKIKELRNSGATKAMCKFTEDDTEYLGEADILQLSNVNAGNLVGVAFPTTETADHYIDISKAVVFDCCARGYSQDDAGLFIWTKKIANTLELDTTLSKTGYAADAKAVGDAIKDAGAAYVMFECVDNDGNMVPSSGENNTFEKIAEAYENGKICLLKFQDMIFNLIIIVNEDDRKFAEFSTVQYVWADEADDAGIPVLSHRAFLSWDSDNEIIFYYENLITDTVNVISPICVKNKAASKSEYALAIGNDAYARDDVSIAIGDSAVAGGGVEDGSQIAIGFTSKATSKYSIALGSYSQAFEDNVLSLGYSAGTDVANEPEHTRRIIHVTDPVNSSDAATKNYVDTSISEIDISASTAVAIFDVTFGNLKFTLQDGSTYTALTEAYNSGKACYLRATGLSQAVLDFDAPIIMRLVLFSSSVAVFNLSVAMQNTSYTFSVNWKQDNTLTAAIDDKECPWGSVINKPFSGVANENGLLVSDGSLTLQQATTTSAGAMSSADKTKLDGIETGANNYTLPTATASTLGGVKIGTGIKVTDGTVSIDEDWLTNFINTTFGGDEVKY